MDFVTWSFCVPTPVLEVAFRGHPCHNHMSTAPFQKFVLSPYPSVDVSVCLSVVLSICLAIYPSIDLSISISIRELDGTTFAFDFQNSSAWCSKFSLPSFNLPVRSTVTCDDALVAGQILRAFANGIDTHRSVQGLEHGTRANACPPSAEDPQALRRQPASHLQGPHPGEEFGFSCCPQIPVV